MRKAYQIWLPLLLVCLVPVVAKAQTFTPGPFQVEQGGGSFRVQCPTATIRHPGTTPTGGAASVNPHPDSQEAAYTGPVSRTATLSPDGHTFSPALAFMDSGGALKCQQISGGDGYVTEADGNQTFMFAFGPLSGLNAIENHDPTGGTQFASHFNNPYCDPTHPNYNSGQPNPYFSGGACLPGTDLNGAVGFVPPYTGGGPGLSIGTDAAAIMNTGVMNGSLPGPLMSFDEDDEFFLTLSNVGMLMRPDLFEQHTVHFHGYPNASSFYDGVPDATWAINIGGSATYYYLAPDAGTYFWHCHITPPEHLQMGMVGWLYVRPRQNRWTPGQALYNASVAQQNDLRTACFPGLPNNGSGTNNIYPSTLKGPDILCSAPLPAANNGVTQGAYPTGTNSAVLAGTTNNGFKYVYNDGDGSTRYDIDVPIQIHGFDPNFHMVGMTFNPEGFADMKDKYFLLNGRSYPDTIGIPQMGATIDGNAVPAAWTGGVASPASTSEGGTNPDSTTYAQWTAASDTVSRPSQAYPAIIVLSQSGGPAGTCGSTNGVANSPCGQRAALRIDDLSVTEYATLSSPSIPMLLIGFNAKILRDQAGNNLYIKTNSITLGGGESLDVIMDSTGIPPGTYFLYTPQLDHLSNDAENFGGSMTEIIVVP